MNIEGVKRLIQKTYGSQAAFARSVGITQQAVSKMLRQDVLSQQVLDALGLEKTTDYRWKDKPARAVKGKING